MHEITRFIDKKENQVLDQGLIVGLDAVVQLWSFFVGRLFIFNAQANSRRSHQKNPRFIQTLFLLLCKWSRRDYIKPSRDWLPALISVIKLLVCTGFILFNLFS